MRMLLIEIPTSSPRKRYKNNPAIAGNILYNQIRLAFLPQNKDFILTNTNQNRIFRSLSGEPQE